MRWLFRHPIAWMVAAEAVVVTTLGGVAWHEVAGGGGAPPPLILPAASPSIDTAADPSVPADALAPPSPDAMPLLPGLNVDLAFWRERLVGLNGAEAQFEALEWRIIHSAMDAIQRYVGGVVLPAVEGAEKRGP